MPLFGGGADWQMSGNDLTNDRNQPYETLIDVGNVATLRPAWTFQTRGSVSATPLATGGYVYVPDWGGGLHKLNANTGQVAWSRKVSEYTGWSDSVSRTTPVLADGVRLELSHAGFLSDSWRSTARSVRTGLPGNQYLLGGSARRYS